MTIRCCAAPGCFLVVFILATVLPHSTAAVRRHRLVSGAALPAASSAVPYSHADPAHHASAAVPTAADGKAPSAPVLPAADGFGAMCSKSCFAACSSCYQQAEEYEEYSYGYGYDYDHHLACKSSTGCPCSVCLNSRLQQ